MSAISKHGPRIAVTLLPLILAMLHTVGLVPMDLLQRLDNWIYDARLSATMPNTRDARVVIVDIDEKSLAEVGRWPWPRNRMAELVNTLFDEQGIAVLGFDILFAEADDSAGLSQLQKLAQGPLADQPGFAERIAALAPELDHDAQFARALKGRSVVLGYYLSNDGEGRVSGLLPAPVMVGGGRDIPAISWDGFGSNIEELAKAAPHAGFFNALKDSDGVLRSLPLLAQHRGQLYESLALAVFRQAMGSPQVELGFTSQPFPPTGFTALDSVRLRRGDSILSIPVDEKAAALIPFRGHGGPNGSPFTYVSASDLLAGRIAPGTMAQKIVLLGTTAPGLLDLQATPMGPAYPGVETHANLITGMLDGQLLRKPDYALGYEWLVQVGAGLLLALALPFLSAWRAVLLSLGVAAAAVGLNTWLYSTHQLVLPLAATLAMIMLASALNMSYGYLFESRSKRQLAHLFGRYVPPILVRKMVKDPASYSMQAQTRQLTVMFCDIRGFTRISETLTPLELQALLNTVFSRLTRVIRGHNGTIDKYMGDCVMAFWGAPVEMQNHGSLAVETAMEMAQAMHSINAERVAVGMTPIELGIGLNTGDMCVGDMGSEIRRSYTVIGDAVNLGARLEGLSSVYGVDAVVSESTQTQAPEFAWQRLDQVRVKGRALSVGIYTPLCLLSQLTPALAQELRQWEQTWKAWRAQDWDACEQYLAVLLRHNEEKILYQLYAKRVASVKTSPPDPGWDGTTVFDTK